MGQVIYADVLIAVNLFINYFMLVAVSKFFYIKVNKIRILLGATLGGIYSLYILIPKCNFIISLFIKLFMAVTVIGVSFGYCELVMYIKLILCFYFISFAFSGLMFALWYALAPIGMTVNNGIVYFNISPVVLIVSTIVSYAVIEFITNYMGKKRNENIFCDMVIKMLDQDAITVRAKVDTGHNITEPFSGLPVVVLSQRVAQKVIPKNLFDIQNYPREAKFDDDFKFKVKNKSRIIPVSTVLGKGLMPAFKAEYVNVCTDKSEPQKEAYIAVCPKNFMNPEFEALINPELME